MARVPRKNAKKAEVYIASAFLNSKQVYGKYSMFLLLVIEVNFL